VRGREATAAADALAHIERQAGRFLIHFDVDVIDCMDCPIADVPQFNTGLTLESVCAALRHFVASPRLAGLVLTEFNPDHTDPDGAGTRRFLEAFTGAFAG
jgi:arginase